MNLEYANGETGAQHNGGDGSEARYGLPRGTFPPAWPHRAERLVSPTAKRQDYLIASPPLEITRLITPMTPPDAWLIPNGRAV